MKSSQDVLNYYQLGALFENLVIAERMKVAHHNGDKPAMYFYRDSNQVEVDLLEETASGISLSEIKSNRTFNKKMLTGLNKRVVLDKSTYKKAANLWW